MSKQRTFRVTIEGIAPLIQDNPAESDLKQLGEKGKKPASKMNDTEAWRKKVYVIDEKGLLGHPTEGMQSLLKESSKNFKGRGRASMEKPVRQNCWVDGEWLTLTNRKEPDSVMLSTPSGTNGRIPAYLPVFKPGWRFTFDLHLMDDEIVSPTTLHDILEWGGRHIGLGKAHYRPKYGRFIIVGWEEIDAKEIKVA